MTRRSADLEMRCLSASWRSYRARTALVTVLVLLAVHPVATGQSPDVVLPAPAGPAVAEEDVSLPAGSQPIEAPENRLQPPLPPQPPAPRESEDLAVALERRGDLNLHGLSLNAALFTIGEQWNINIVAGEVEGTVNGTFRQAPLREILDSILLSNGYNYRPVGKSLVISKISDLGQINPFFKSATIPVRSADIDEVVEGAKLLSTPQGQVKAMKSVRSILVLDFPDRVEMIREFVHTIESVNSGRFASADGRTGLPLEVAYFRTQHIPARAAEQVLQGILSSDGRTGIMEKEDRLVVTDYPENLTMVEKVLQRIDHPRPQVRITALIYDISLQDISRMGINWGHQVGSSVDASGVVRQRDTAFDVDSVMQVPFQAGTAGSTLTFMNLSRHLDITAVALWLQQASDARLLADPNVAVLENEEAIFQKVSEIPYQQLTQTQQGGNIGTTAFKQAGITLTVRPKIAAEGLIQMEVKPEISRLSGFTPGDNQPIIDINSTATVLTVANRQIVVIGGLRQRSDVGDFTGVPYLKDMNLLGRLFRSRETDVRESELIVFISPEIIGYADDPTLRQQAAAETIRCRLDQMPEAEGCPPCCRRLPTSPTLPPCDVECLPPGIDDPSLSPATETIPPTTVPTPVLPPELPPLSAADIPSSEFQFGVAGRTEQVRVLMTEGRLRRLPKVERGTLPGSPKTVRVGLFDAPPTPAGNARGTPAATMHR